jgi:UDP-sulfoquinovose synthase
MKDVAPDAHLIKLGTMGEFGTPNIDIIEGDIEIELNGRKDTFMFPKKPGSFYHLSKVHDTNNIRFACETWGLRSTDIMQGVVFGASAYGVKTRFDYDESFGTVINRFCAQAVSGHNLTIYGRGEQVRGFLPLEDSLQCINLIANHPPQPSEHRIVHQFENIYSLNKLASVIARSFYRLTGQHVQFDFIPNPRSEKLKHYYKPEHRLLFSYGYIPSDMDSHVKRLLQELIPYKDSVKKELFLPKIKWK